jgi:hypothetical protein
MMPVFHRRWFIKRIIAESEKQKEKQDDSQSSIGENMKKLSEFEKMMDKKNS